MRLLGYRLRVKPLKRLRPVRQDPKAVHIEGEKKIKNGEKASIQYPKQTTLYVKSFFCLKPMFFLKTIGFERCLFDKKAHPYSDHLWCVCTEGGEARTSHDLQKR